MNLSRFQHGGVADQIAIAMDMENRGWTGIELIGTIDEMEVVK